MRQELAIGAWLMLATVGKAEPPERAAEEFFESKVRPVMVEKCYSCHGEKKQSGGLRLDSRDTIVKGGDTGPALVTGKPNDSLMIHAVKRTGELKMPPKEELSAEQIAALEKWIQDGAVWPKSVESKPAIDLAKTHWAFQPVKTLPIPADMHPVDVLVQAKLAEKGLKQNSQADAVTLIRRMTFDLHGLPPTPDEVDAFVRDSILNQKSAIHNLVDRLLASPRYGERWGRHWLDVARYADTMGYFFEGERRYPFAYTYRDYVIRSFNEDKPYDHFIIEQLAADQVCKDGDKKDLAAMGFLTVGRRFLNDANDIIDDRLDVISRGFLGLSVHCARCHDHKFDPIPTQDYYSLHGVLASSTEPKDLPMIGKPADDDFEKVLKKRQTELDQFVQKKTDQWRDANRTAAVLLTSSTQSFGALAGYLVEPKELQHDRLQKVIPKTDQDRWKKMTASLDEHRYFSPNAPPRAMVINEASKPVESVVFVRGNPGNRGAVVPRQFLSVLSGAERKPFQQGSGRLELAKCIADAKNPLTARVMVNRIWMHHFGRGLVNTPSDFGVRSDPPTHPELLDWLASEFVRSGWSIKTMHRIILTSATYQQSSVDRPELATNDPENRWMAKFPRQRLEFESLRDSMLAVGGLLNLKEGGPSVELNREPFTYRRTVYGYVERQNLPGMFRAFDFANPDTHSPQRFKTTVPQQALYFMNSKFVAHVAKALVRRPEINWTVDPDERIESMYRLLFGRRPKADELELGRRFIDRTPAGTEGTPWEQYAQGLLMTNEFAFVE